MAEAEFPIVDPHQVHFRPRHVPVVAHQFDDLQQETEADTLGMWTFLATEVLFFGGMIAGYTVYRSTYWWAWRNASVVVDNLRFLGLSSGAWNTAVLLTSSLTVALAVRAAKMGNQRQLLIHLILTILLGLGFLGIKACEYTHEAHEGVWPGQSVFHPDKDSMDQLHIAAREHGLYFPALLREFRLFWCFYFFMTGIHALHMIIGIGVFTYLLIQSKRGRYTPLKHAQVEISALYWHFVDLVWIFLFPLLYLVR